MSSSRHERVVIVGGGFADLYATQALRRAPARITAEQLQPRFLPTTAQAAAESSTVKDSTCRCEPLTLERNGNA